MLIFALFACATLSSDGEPSPTPTASAPDAPVAQPAQETAPVEPSALLPPHFTPEQIQAGMPVGTTLVFEIATYDTVVGTPFEGVETKQSQWEVLSADPDSVRIRYSTPGGAESTEKSHSWTELATHSQFPEQHTTREDKLSVTVPAGTFSCTRYTVREAGDEVSVYDFADGLSGPPIQLVQTAAGQERMHMVLLRRAVP